MRANKDMVSREEVCRHGGRGASSYITGPTHINPVTASKPRDVGKSLYGGLVMQLA